MQPILSRIAEVQTHLGLSVTKFALSIGVPQTTLSNMFNRDSTPKTELLNKIVEVHQVNPSYLLTGEGPMFAGQEVSPLAPAPSMATYRGGGLRELQETLTEKLVPFLTQMVSAGPGEELLEYEDSCGLICLPEAAVKGELRALRVKGDSMEPTLRPGDIVVCDQNGWQGDGVYVIRDQDSAYVKRVRRVREGLEVISDNTAYKPWQCPSEELVLVGRVVFCVVRL